MESSRAPSGMEEAHGNALTGDVIMTRLGVYDLFSTKEVRLSMSS